MSAYKIFDDYDPDAKLDYTIDWERWLGDDVIFDSTWAVDIDSLILYDDDATTTTTVIWVQGGVAGTDYRVTNHIVTAAGREQDQTFVIRCWQR
jgi:hypothetical protein